MAGVVVWTIVSLLFLVGILGTAFPALPGVGLIWLGITVYAVATHFEEIGGGAVVALGALALMASVASYAGGMLAARAAGSRKLATVGAGIGAMVGLSLLSVPGLLLGGFLGAFAGALWESREGERAIKTAALTVVGILAGTVLQFLLGVGMIAGFFWQIWAGR